MDTSLRWLALLSLGACTVSCGAACPPAGAFRLDLPPNVATARLQVVLASNRLAQPNNFPASLVLSWSDAPSGAAITVYDASHRLRLRRSANAARATPATIRLVDDAERPLPAGEYRVEVDLGEERATASFEICHCTVYY